MNKILILILSYSFLMGQSDDMTVQDIIKAMDNNLNAKSRVITSKMIVHGRRSSRTIESRNWVVGTDQAFTAVSYTHLTLPTKRIV